VFPVTLTLWLAKPAARLQFDAEAQTPEDRARWEQITSPQRRAEWEVSRALLAHARANAAHDARLSLSHSGGYAAVAASREASQVGVDLERVRERAFLRLARFAFSASEHAQLEALPASARAERFYILWTLKEAFAKALAVPLLQIVSQCTFVACADAWHASVPVPDAWIARVFRPQPEFVLSVVALLSESAPENLALTLREWPEQQPPTWPTLVTLRSHDTHQ
jgi:4'-phosphopantetheinyl transferase